MKAMRIFLAVLFIFLLGAEGQAQFKISGNQVIEEDCCELYTFNIRDTVGYNATWEISDVNGNVIYSENDNGPNYQFELCPWEIQGISSPIILSISIPDLQLRDVITIELIPTQPLDIFTNYPCIIQDSFFTVQICEGNIGDYAVEISNPNGILWNVTGGTIIQNDGWNIKVRWDQPGLHTVTVEDFSTSCPKNQTLQVEVLPLPVAEFETTPAYDQNRKLSICKGQTVYFDNKSQNMTDVLWNLGSGETSDQVNTEYTFENPGQYRVLLILDTGCECVDSNYLEIEVKDAISPTLTCTGTTCPGESHTYYVENDCPETIWVVSANGNVLDGGGLTDDFITVEWNSGPYGEISILGQNCPSGYCPEPTIVRIPVISTDGPITGDQIVCEGQIETYEVPFFQGTSYSWNISSGGTLVSSNQENTITVIWNRVQAPNSNQWVEVSYDNCYIECGGLDRINVEVQGRYQITGDLAYCDNESPLFQSENIAGASVDCQWSITNASGQIVDQSASSDDEYLPLSPLTPGNYTVKAQIVIPGYCDEFVESEFEIFANPTPPVGIITESEVCKGVAHAIELQNPDPAFIVRWEITDGAQSTSYEQQDQIFHIFSSNGPYAVAAFYREPGGLGCESVATSIQLQSYQFSVIGPQQVCPESVAKYQCASVKPSGFEWRIQPVDAGVIVSGQGEDEVEVFWATPGNHRLILEHCGGEEDISVTVPARETLTVQAPNDVCEGDMANVSILENVSAINWLDDQGQSVATGSNAVLAAGHYRVTAETQDGCPLETVFRINEKPAPDAVISFGEIRAFCDTEPFTPRILYANTDGNYSYQWFFNGMPTGGNSSTLKASFFGTYHCIVTNNLGCSKRSNDLVLILECDDDKGRTCNGKCKKKTCPNDFVTFDILDAGIYCNQKILRNTTPGTIVSHQWLIEDLRNNGWVTDYTIEPTHTFLSAGYHMIIFDAEVQPSSVPGLFCQDNIIQVVKIPLAAWFNAPNECVGEPVQFEDLTTYIPGETINSYNWDFGDPMSGADNFSVLSDPSHQYVSPGKYTITLTVEASSGCISEYQKEIEIYDAPNFNISAPAQVCVGSSVSISAPTDLFEVEWDFGNAGAANNTVNATDAHFAYDQVGNYQITLNGLNAFGCEAQYVHNVQVIDVQNKEDITVMGSLPLCAGQDVTLRGPSTATSWQWSNGMTGQNIIVSIPGEYTVQVVTPDGCRYETQAIKVEVHPLPSATAVAHLLDDQNQRISSSSYKLDVCEGDRVELEALGISSNSYRWSTGRLGQIATHTNWSPPGTYPYYVEVRDPSTGCDNQSNIVEVIIHEKPSTPNITPDRTGVLCENIPVTFTVTNYDSRWNYVWSNGMRGSSITVSGSGSYSVTAYNDIGCEAESNSLFIAEAPNADVVMTGCLTRCDPDTICLPRIRGAYTYQWFLDGAPIPAPDGQIKDFIATQSGTYRLEVTSFAGCTDMSGPLELEITPGYGDISVTVYLDVNDNGILDAGDILMEDIEVVLEDDQGGQSQDQTDGQGEVWYYNQSAGDYSASVINDTLEVVPGNHDTTIIGCDDDYPLVILLRKKCPQTLLSLDTSICSLDTLFWADTMLVGEGMHTWSVTNSDGCQDEFEVSLSHELPEHEIVIQVYRDMNGNNVIDLDDELYPGLDVVVLEAGIEVWRGKVDQSGQIRFDGNSESDYEIYIDSTLLGPDYQIIQGFDRITVDGCTGNYAVNLLISLIQTQVYVPNVFTPNGDNTNDVFRVFTGNEGDRITYFAIYDRWGELVFESTDKSSPEDVGWDGTLNGHLLNPSVFVYVVDVETFLGKREQLSGDVTLLR